MWYKKVKVKLKKIGKIYIHELAVAVIILINTLCLMLIRNSKSYEIVAIDQLTPKSSCRVIMKHHPFIGYAYLVCGFVLILAVLYRLFKFLKKDI